MNVSLGLAHEVEVMLRKVGATRETFWKPIARDKKLANEVFELVSGYVGFDIKIDKNDSLSMLVIKGKYSQAHEEIYDFSFCQKKKIQEMRVILFEFSNPRKKTLVSIKEIKKEIENSGYKIASIREFLTFGAQHPECQLKFHVHCLDVVKNKHGSLYIPILTTGFEKDRVLHVRTESPDTFSVSLSKPNRCRFLVVQI